jgi:hypothetical protein
MDGARFDAIARSLAQPGSRRRLLAGLAAAALGLAGRDRAGAVACRTPGLLCRENADCCARVCAADAAGRRVCRCRTAADCPPPTNRCLAATCAAGVCGTAPAVHCAAIDQCHLAGACVPATGTCTNPAKANGTACDDGDRRTTGDHCQDGACVGTKVVCTAQDQCHSAGCDPGTGTCAQTPLTGTPCDDGNACTQHDTCQAGVCTAGAPKVCAACQTCQGGSCVSTCAAGQVCHQGACCTPDATTCAGKCSPATDNCGQDCGATCAADQVCHQGACCTPDAQATTCAGNKCGTITNNCGQGVDCGGCPTNYACLHGACFQTCLSPINNQCHAVCTYGCRTIFLGGSSVQQVCVGGGSGLCTTGCPVGQVCADGLNCGGAC